MSRIGFTGWSAIGWAIAATVLFTLGEVALVLVTIAAITVMLFKRPIARWFDRLEERRWQRQCQEAADTFPERVADLERIVAERRLQICSRGLG